MSLGLLSDSGNMSSPTHGPALCCGFVDRSWQLILGSVALPITLKVIQYSAVNTLLFKLPNIDSFIRDEH